FTSELAALQALQIIRAKATITPLHEVLAEYLASDAPENAVMHRWEHDFLPSKQAEHARREISRARLYELERLPLRGYLAFFAENQIHVSGCDDAAIFRWYEWLRATWPTMKPVSTRHILTNFRTFLRYEKRIGAIERVPDFPVVKLPKEG